MEKVPKDVGEMITNELTPQEFINFCVSNLAPNFRKLCNNPEIWSRRFSKDFGFLVIYFDDLSTNAKQRYLAIFSKISKQVEKVMNLVLGAFEDFKKYLNDEYKQDLYNSLYNNILKSIQKLLREEEITEDILHDMTIDIWISWQNDSLIPPYFSSHGKVDEELSYFWSDLISSANFDDFFIDILEYINKDININIEQ